MDFDLYQLLIAGHYLGQLPFTVGTQKLPVFFGKLFGINGLAVFQHHMGGADEGEMILQDGGCVVHAHEDDGTAGFLGHFKAALLEGGEAWSHPRFCSVCLPGRYTWKFLL